MGGLLSFRDYSFDDSSGYGATPATPLRTFWAVANDNSYGGPVEKAQTILKWQNDVLEALLPTKEAITEVQKVNTRLYKGKHYFDQEQFYALSYNRGKKYSKRFKKIVCPYLHQATEQHVADMCGYEPSLTVEATNNEEQDKVAQKINDQVLQFYFSEMKIVEAFQPFHRRKKIHGEAFKFVLWNEDIGDLHPKYKQLREMKQQMGQDPDAPVPLMDPETGEPMTDDNGGQIFLSRALKTGDIEVVDEYSWNVVYPEPASGLWKDVPYLWRIVPMDLDEALARWPQHQLLIKASCKLDRYYVNVGSSLTPKVWLRYFYHPPTTFLSAGYYSISTEHVILEEGKYPYRHNKLPCIRGTDIDVPGEIHGMSFYQLLVTLADAINESTSMILENQSLFARPKRAVPKGAKVKWLALDDDHGMYEYSGPKPPELMTENSTPSDTWRWRDAMRDEFKTHSAIFATSEGRGVDGITANVALRLIEEQERKLHKPAIDKHNADCETLGFLMMSTLGTYRQPDDGSMIKILGKNNERLLKYFDGMSLSRPFEVKLKKSSGLPNSPAAKLQTVLDLNSAQPGLWSKEEFLENVGMPKPESMIESATIARRAAESEVEDLMQGMEVQPPQPYQDILAKYPVYERAVQGRQFEESDPILKQRMMMMILTAEHIIYEKMKVNPTFAQRVLINHPNFPMFFALPTPNPNPVILDDGMGMSPTGGADPLGGVPPEAAGGNAGVPPMPQQTPSPSPASPQPAPPEGSAPPTGQLP